MDHRCLFSYFRQKFVTPLRIFVTVGMSVDAAPNPKHQTIAIPIYNTTVHRNKSTVTLNVANVRVIS